MSEFIIDKEILVKQQEFIKDCEEKIHLKNEEGLVRSGFCDTFFNTEPLDEYTKATVEQGVNTLNRYIKFIAGCKTEGGSVQELYNLSAESHNVERFMTEMYGMWRSLPVVISECQRLAVPLHEMELMEQRMQVLSGHIATFCSRKEAIQEGSADIMKEFGDINAKIMDAHRRNNKVEVVKFTEELSSFQEKHKELFSEYYALLEEQQGLIQNYNAMKLGYFGKDSTCGINGFFTNFLSVLKRQEIWGMTQDYSGYHFREAIKNVIAYMHVYIIGYVDISGEEVKHVNGAVDRYNQVGSNREYSEEEITQIKQDVLYITVLLSSVVNKIPDDAYKIYQRLDRIDEAVKNKVADLEYATEKFETLTNRRINNSALVDALYTHPMLLALGTFVRGIIAQHPELAALAKPVLGIATKLEAYCVGNTEFQKTLYNLPREEGAAMIENMVNETIQKDREAFLSVDSNNQLLS